MLRRTFLAAIVAAPYKVGTGWKRLFNGRDLTGWHGDGGGRNQWSVSKEELSNGLTGKTVNLATAEKFGDVELYLEFRIPKGSNSGVYLQGLYEIQIFDSFGVAQPKSSDCGAIYHRWIDEKPVDGSPPKINASLPPEEWQSFHAWFQAPRFHDNGKKADNAKFVKVLHNGKLVQENVVLRGGTRSHMEIAEAALNPLMLQGDHGPVAFRNIYLRSM